VTATVVYWSLSEAEQLRLTLVLDALRLRLPRAKLYVKHLAYTENGTEPVYACEIRVDNHAADPALAEFTHQAVVELCNIMTWKRTGRNHLAEDPKQYGSYLDNPILPAPYMKDAAE
jgi:hypothetical protein